MNLLSMRLHFTRDLELLEILLVLLELIVELSQGKMPKEILILVAHKHNHHNGVQAIWEKAYPQVLMLLLVLHSLLQNRVFSQLDQL